MSVKRANPKDYFEEIPTYTPAGKLEPDMFQVPQIQMPTLGQPDIVNLLVILGIVSLSAIAIIGIVAIVCFFGSRQGG